jgi:hypothetical protein
MQPVIDLGGTGMRGNLEHRAAEIEKTSQDQEETSLSRRTFLARLTILGVGCAAAMTFGVSEAGATAESDAAGKAKALADDKARTECKKAEAVDEVDPVDPLEISAQRGRRVARRQVRRVYRRGRRVSRRVYRRARRRWICWWRRGRRVCGWRWY